jgi:Ras and Rab interactor 2/3
MEINSKDKSDDEELLLAKEYLESAAESSSDGGVLAEGEDESSSCESEISGSPSPQLDISLMERLLRTHPVWFLPSLQRGGSVHLLQGKEVGTFIVRSSSQKNTMAISVRLPPKTGPYIEHYLIQSNDGLLNLESSRFKFDSIPSLVAHYSNCCDELPVQLSLPRGLRDATNRQQLMSLALLGSEFWRCPSALPQNEDETHIKSPTETSGISTMAELSSLKQKNNNSIMTKLNLKGTSNNINNNNTSQLETPSDTASSLSSFPASGATSTLLSPQSIDNCFIASPSGEFCNLKSSNNSINNLNSPSGIIGKTSTFKAQTSFPSTPISSSQPPPLQPKPIQQSTFDFHHQQQQQRDDNHNEECAQQQQHRTRPTPPNTLNLASVNR